nr:hypothetical protein [Streptomyces uncialis]
MTQPPCPEPYRALRDSAERLAEDMPGKLEIARESIVHDRGQPNAPHSLTAARL